MKTFQGMGENMVIMAIKEGSGEISAAFET